MFLLNNIIHHTASLTPARLMGEEKMAVVAKPNLSFCSIFFASVPTTVFAGGVNVSPINRFGLTYSPT